MLINGRKIASATVPTMLIKVSMTNAAEADEMFRILMGDKVEPRREFIEKHALDVKDLDV